MSVVGGIKYGDASDAHRYLALRGLEYLSALREEWRRGAFSELGASPKLFDFCRFVRDCGVPVLSVRSCVGLMAVQVAGSHVQLVRSADSAAQLYDALLRLAFIPYEYLDDSERVLLGLSIGDPAYRVAVEDKDEIKPEPATVADSTVATFSSAREVVVAAKGHLLSTEVLTVSSYGELFSLEVRDRVAARLGTDPSVLDLYMEYCYRTVERTAILSDFYLEVENNRAIVRRGIRGDSDILGKLASASASALRKYLLGRPVTRPQVSFLSSGEPDGFCYLYYFDAELWSEVAARCGALPKLDVVCLELAYAILLGKHGTNGVWLESSGDQLLHASFMRQAHHSFQELCFYYGFDWSVGARPVSLFADASKRRGGSVLEEFSAMVPAQVLKLGTDCKKRRLAVGVGDVVVVCTRGSVEQCGLLECRKSVSAFPLSTSVVYKFGAINTDSLVYLHPKLSVYKEGFEVTSDRGLYVHVLAGAVFEVLVRGVLSQEFVLDAVPKGVSWSSELRDGLTDVALEVPRVPSTRATLYRVLGQTDARYHYTPGVRFAMERTDHLVRVVRGGQDSADVIAGGEWVETTDPYESWKAIETWRTLQSGSSDIATLPPLSGIVVCDSFNTESGVGCAAIGPVRLQAGNSNAVAVDVGGVSHVDLVGSSSNCSLYVSCVADDYCYDNGGPSDGEFTDAFLVGRCADHN